MDRVIFGDNQFFAVNHMSDEKSRAQAMRFKDTASIIEVLDYVYDIGIRTFMCTTHDKIGEVCEHIRKHPGKYDGFKMYPCMPYAHKYNNAVAELGAMGALKKILPGGILGGVAKGGVALARKDYISLMKQLVDAEMNMFRGIETGVVFLQNVVTDLILGMGMNDYFVAFSDYVREKHNSEPGFITMNLPALLTTLERRGIENPIICASINQKGFRMSGSMEHYTEVMSSKRCRLIAMQVLAAGAIAPDAAMKYIGQFEGVESVLFGASSQGHIKQTNDLILKYSG